MSTKCESYDLQCCEKPFPSDVISFAYLLDLNVLNQIHIR